MGSTSRKARSRRAREKKIAAAPLPISQPTLWPDSASFNLGLLTVLGVILFRDVFLHPEAMLCGHDLVRLHSTLKAAQFHAVADQGRFPLWDPTDFGGRSIVGDPVAAVLNPLAWLFWISPSPALFGFYFWFYVTAGAIGVWLWMRRLGAEPVGAFVAAMAFAFSGKTAGHLFAGHLEFLPGVLCLPWVLWAAQGVVQRRTLGSAVSLGAVLCVTATMGSVQALYWHVLVVGVYLPAHGLRQGGWADARRATGLLVRVGLVFSLGAMAWWLPIVRQTLLLSARAGEGGGGFDFATMGSAAPSDLHRLVSPFAGIALPVPFASDPENGFFWESASYPGLVALSLAGFLVLIAPKDRRTVILGLAALLALALALGRHTPLYRLAYDVVPGFSMFRAPGRLLFFANLCLAGMAGFGIGELLRVSAARRWVFVVVLAVLLAVAAAGPAALDPSAANPAGGPTLAILVLVALLLAGVLFSTGTVSGRGFVVMTLTVGALDLGTVWATHLVTARPEDLLRSNSVVGFLEERQREGPFRYFDPTETVPQQLAARHGLQTITGYHPGIYGHQLELYQALWPPGEGSDLVQLLMHSPQDIVCTPILDLMNTRYVVAYEPELDDRFVKGFSTPAGEFGVPRHVFERRDALPRVFVVPRSVRPSDNGGVLQAVCAANPRESCVLETAPLEGGAPFQATVPTSERAGDVRMDFETPAGGVLVVSQSWHPDWVATDQGAPLAVLRANHGFLGLPLGAGAHSIHLWYRPWDFYLGCVVSSVFWLSVGVVLVLTRRRRSGAAQLPPLNRDSSIGPSRTGA